MATERTDPALVLGVFLALFLAGFVCGYYLDRLGGPVDSSGADNYADTSSAIEGQLEHAGDELGRTHESVGSARIEVAGYSTEVGELGRIAGTINADLGEDKIRVEDIERGISQIEAIIDMAEKRNEALADGGDH